MDRVIAPKLCGILEQSVHLLTWLDRFQSKVMPESTFLPINTGSSYTASKNTTSTKKSWGPTERQSYSAESAPGFIRGDGIPLSYTSMT